GQGQRRIDWRRNDLGAATPTTDQSRTSYASGSQKGVDPGLQTKLDCEVGVTAGFSPCKVTAGVGSERSEDAVGACLSADYTGVTCLIVLHVKPEVRHVLRVFHR
ncbi:hypothetical protein Vafri_20197, partial [Volvox africanus]